MTSVPSTILGRMTLEKNENLDEFLTAKGVPWLTRKAVKGKMAVSSSTRTLSDLGDGKYRMNVTGTPIGEVDYVFTLGEPVEVNSPPAGKKHKITFTVSGDRLLEHHEVLEGDHKGDTEATEYYIEDGYVVAAISAEKVVWKRYYKKIN